MPFKNPFRREPAPPGFGAGKVVPEVIALWPSRVFLYWLSPFLSVGFTRPLQEEDLWSLPDHELTENVANDLERRFFLRCEPAARPRHLREQLAEIEANSPSASKAVKPEKVPDSEKADVEVNQAGASDENTTNEQQPPSPYDASLFKTLHSMLFSRIWISGFLTLFADTLRTTTPLVSKVLLEWLASSYLFVRLGEAERAAIGLTEPRGIAYGIGVAIGIFAMQEGASLMSNHALKISMTAGQVIRTGVTGAACRKALRISGRARQEHTVGQIITMISTDATQLEMFMTYIHQLWIAPIQLILGFGLLIGTLGYSALVGLGVIIFGFPLQIVLVKIMFTQRNKAIKITDKRTQLTNEVLQGIRLVKCYGWETFYLLRIGGLRAEEVKAIRKGVIALSTLICVFHSIPIIAAILSFITYSLTGHDLNVAVIFASVQLFNVIRIPLLMLPFALSSLASGLISMNRMSKFLASEELEQPYILDATSKNAVDVDGGFTWEAVKKTQAEEEKKSKKNDDTGSTDASESKGKKGKPAKKSKKGADDATLPSNSNDIKGAKEEEPSEPEEPPYELKELKFSVPKGAFVGIVGRIGSGKSSVLQAIIGEMRKTQGQIVVGGSLAYVPQIPWIQNATLRDNILFGQPEDEARLRDIIRACSLNHDISTLPHGELTEIGEKGINLSGGQKARVSLARAAYSNSDIVLLDDPLSAVDAHVGRSILDNCLLSGPLATRTRILVTHSLHVLPKMDYIFVMDQGRIVEQGTYQELRSSGATFSRIIEEYGRVEGGHDVAKTADPRRQATTTNEAVDSQLKEAKDVLMQLEERNTGAVEWEVYKRYAGFAGGLSMIPLIIVLLLVGQAVSVGNNLWLGFWTADSVDNFSTGQYMAVYAGFGLGEAVIVFLGSLAFFIGGLVASLRMFRSALKGILRSPLSFFDTTPMGRIVSRLSKDQETLDNELAPVLFSFLSIVTSVFGVIALIFYTFPWLGIIFVPLTVIYYLVSVYYRASSVETKRLDAILRSSLYASVSETLTVTMVFSEMVSQFAQNEQNMNAVERVTHYTELPPEGDLQSPDDPPTSWPQNGGIQFNNVDLVYRPGLPLVLKNVSFSIRPREKVGIVGRTGAGKTSLLQALFRTVELSAGSIEIDGVDVRKVGLETLRTRLALVPQDNTLFMGTLRDNLDPHHLRTDAEILAALQRASLLPAQGVVDQVAEDKFRLDASVTDEGSNFSAGEKQLLALCRALVRNNRVIILDEATSNVDVETDAKVQRTIQTEFADSTLLCIAHRLNTIAYYDRVLVMDGGSVAEFDTVLNLFDKEDSIFRALCNEANLSRSDILRIREEQQVSTADIQEV
ncbi:hypothetical protein EST38_g3441 [Candolleomyces aberdarensis]|uniref:Multidrug resistance-associated ABC transporter n=1 Tax=Candolleomyces aberdarensis TaxID=2316362 RepID=A0A4Q2DT25_9AGAR|nr:hypothetical protein EST38_g3441 [Candolleomyces aberdarensis]